ncbi:MAG: cyclic nucleotide-binding domain-containing protein [Desulfobacterales bacterium]|jgi:CRP-like cAMP-binding protein
MAGDVAFAGNLSFLNLGEILQLLGTTSGSGILRIISNYAPEPGVVYIDKGNPINASNGSKAGLDALFSLFGWKDGQFEFIQEPVTCEKVINKSRMEIILDGLRLLDEGKVEVLGPSGNGAKPVQKAEKSGSLQLIKGPLVDYSFVVDEEGFYDGDEIVHEGNHGNWIWVILEGIAEIIKETPQGRLKLLRIGDGAFLGSVASLLKGDNVRSATVIANGNVQLGMLDAQLMTSELANCSLEYRDFVRALDKRLKQVTDMAVAIHSKNKEVTEFIKGKKILIKQGQEEDRLFRVRAGEAYVVRETEAGIVPLVCLEKDDFFGSVPFLDMGHEPYSASILAAPNLKIGSLDPNLLQKEHEKLSSTLQNILGYLANCISVTTLIATDYFMRSFSK